MSVAHSREQFSLAEARRIIKDLFRPDPRVYWFDFTVSMVIGHVLFVLVVAMPHLIPSAPGWMWIARVAAFLVCGLMYYRSALFIHELIHLPSERFVWFGRVWNFFCGCPFFMPSFVYFPHIDHHRRKHYGTEHDGEYVALRTMSRWHTLGFVAQTLVIPLLAVVRFYLLTPLTWLSPKLRELIHRHASSMIMDPSYLRPLPTKETLKIIRRQEILCFVWCLEVTVLLATILRPWALTILATAYLLGVFIIGVNAIRTLGAHLWSNDEGEMSFVEQMLDSINYPYRPAITELWGPLGLRYHALHHLFPSLPYHNMGEAHRRLMRDLPEDSPYRKTVRVSLLAVVWELLWARRSKPETKAPSSGELSAT